MQNSYYMTNKPMIVSLYTINALNYIWLQLFLLYSGGPHYCPNVNSIMEQFQVLGYISVISLVKDTHQLYLYHFINY